MTPPFYERFILVCVERERETSCCYVPGLRDVKFNGSFTRIFLHPLEISETLTLIKKNGGYNSIFRFSENIAVWDIYCMNFTNGVGLIPLAVCTSRRLTRVVLALPCSSRLGIVIIVL